MRPQRETLKEKRRTNERPQRERGLIDGMASGDEGPTVDHVVFVAWVATAGLYGYLAAEWGGEWPEPAGVFFLFGLALGVAFSATFVRMDDRRDG